MRNRGGIARYVTVCVICFSLIVYGITDFFSGSVTTESTKISDMFFHDSSYVFKNFEALTENKSKEKDKNETSSESSSTVPAISNGEAKGKIITNYISPYTVGLSYDQVYVKNATDLSIDIKTYLEQGLSFSLKKNDEPQVLIMHTHTTESFMQDNNDYYTAAFSSRSNDQSKNMVAIGNIVTDKLNASGIKTIHDTTEHDYPQYNGSYTRAAKTINGYLKKHDSIKIVLDLHRDAMASGETDKVKVVTDINGKKAAQVMLVMGSQSGGVTNFPDWEENFSLAVKVQQQLEKMYPTLARPISLTSKNYNESLTHGSLLIEFGTDANNMDEVLYSAELVGNALSELLNTLT